MENKEKDIRKIELELEDLEKVTGGTGTLPKKNPEPISDDTQENV